jgi:hypothetical protein
VVQRGLRSYLEFQPFLIELAAGEANQRATLITGAIGPPALTSALTPASYAAKFLIKRPARFFANCTDVFYFRIGITAGNRP